MKLTNLLLSKIIFSKLKSFVAQNYFYRFLKLRIYKGVILRNKLRRVFDPANQLPFQGTDVKKKILVPLIETSHYQFLHVLLIAKALEIRGADVRILVCNSFLPACEIKSSRNTKTKPCLDCNMNRDLIVPEFGLKTINLAELVPTYKVEELRLLAKSLVSNYPLNYEYCGIDIINMVNDSVTRYFYGVCRT